MRNLVFSFCILSLVACAPSKSNFESPIGTEQTKTQAIDTCVAVNTNVDVKPEYVSNQIKIASEIDPNYSNYIVKYKTAPNLEAGGSKAREYSVASAATDSIVIKSAAKPACAELLTNRASPAWL